MKSLFIKTYCILTLFITLSACHEYDEWDNNPIGNFDALWTIIDEHYCFFEEKNINWEEIGNKYRKRIIPSMSQTQLFDVCAEMIDELKDGHTNLIAPFNISYYQKWWTDYPQDFDYRVLQEYYLGFDSKQSAGIIYKIMKNNVGYIYYPSFSSAIGDGNIDWVLSDLIACNALIIDIRNNGGGELTNIEKFLRRFIHQPTLGGYIRHKTGPGHSDFSDPYPFYYEPVGNEFLKWDKPVIVLTNRSCYSAANDFVAIMKSLPNVRIVGAKTGGGGGLPFSAELPNGWSIRFSACPITDYKDRQIENGIEPSAECEVHCTSEELSIGKDAILDFALSLFD